MYKHIVLIGLFRDQKLEKIKGFDPEGNLIPDERRKGALNCDHGWQNPWKFPLLQKLEDKCQQEGIHSAKFECELTVETERSPHQGMKEVANWHEATCEFTEFSEFLEEVETSS